MANENTTFLEILTSINSNAETLEEIAKEIENLQKTAHSRNITVEDWNAVITGLNLECGGLVANVRNLIDTINVTESLLATKADTTDVDDISNALDTKVDKLTDLKNNVRIHGAWYNSEDGVIQGSITPYGNRIMIRDGSGRSQVENPSADKDIANKAYVDSHGGAGTVKSVNGVEPDADGKLTLQAGDVGAAPVVGGKIPASYIPGSYDDVIEGYYYNLKFYEEASHTTEITGESGKLYVDIPNNKSYRYTGSGYTAISDFDPSTIITQVTGSAQDKVMSQKAVTDLVSGLQSTSNLTTSISQDSTDTKYPSAKAVYNAIVRPLVVETLGYASYDNDGFAPNLTYKNIQDLIAAHHDGRPCFVKLGTYMYNVVGTSQNWLLLQSPANHSSSFLDITYYAYDITSGENYIRAYLYKAIPETQLSNNSGTVINSFAPHAYRFYGQNGLSSLTVTSFAEQSDPVEEPFWSISFKAASSGITVTLPSNKVVWLGGTPSFKAGHVYMLMFTKHPNDDTKLIGVWGESV